MKRRLLAALAAFRNPDLLNGCIGTKTLEELYERERAAILTVEEINGYLMPKLVVIDQRQAQRALWGTQWG